MKVYIATFFSHFGAIQFKRQCEKSGMTAKVMPVPRFLSSSCGTCVRFECENDMISDKMPEELEQIVEVQGKQYTAVYRVKE